MAAATEPSSGPGRGSRRSRVSSTASAPARMNSRTASGSEIEAADSGGEREENGIVEISALKEKGGKFRRENSITGAGERFPRAAPGASADLDLDPRRRMVRMDAKVGGEEPGDRLFVLAPIFRVDRGESALAQLQEVPIRLPSLRQGLIESAGRGDRLRPVGADDEEEVAVREARYRPRHRAGRDSPLEVGSVEHRRVSGDRGRGGGNSPEERLVQVRGDVGIDGIEG